MFYFHICICSGKCPIYNYENGATVATSHSCANFTNGCPSPVENPYHSNSFYKCESKFSLTNILNRLLIIYRYQFKKYSFRDVIFWFSIILSVSKRFGHNLIFKTIFRK